MSRFSDAFRQVVYMLDCPLANIANGAKCSRSTVYEAMHEKRPITKRTAKALAVSVLVEIDGQIERRRAEIERLQQRGQELRGAYNIEFGGSTGYGE